jgi:hypothetical protein
MPSDPSNLITIASIIAGFGVAVLMFRLQRELSLCPRDRWLACADWLAISSTLIALMLVIVPLVFFAMNRLASEVAGAATCLTVILLAGYVPSILAHYRLIFRGNRDPNDPRRNPEPAELAFIVITSVTAIFVAGAFLIRACPLR